MLITADIHIVRLTTFSPIWKDGSPSFNMAEHINRAKSSRNARLQHSLFGIVLADISRSFCGRAFVFPGMAITTPVKTLARESLSFTPVRQGHVALARQSALPSAIPETDGIHTTGAADYNLCLIPEKRVLSLYIHNMLTAYPMNTCPPRVCTTVPI